MMFWVAGFVYTYDPRHVDTTPDRPFLPYQFQVDTMLTLLEALRNKSGDVLVEKSRDLGASWMPLAVYTYCFIFDHGVDFLVGSRKEEYVDKAGDKKTLFWKIDYILQHLPRWMQPAIKRNKLLIQNLANDSTITGESANPDFGRGDRKTSLLLDEFASCENDTAVLAATDDTTPVRFLVSTPKGTGNEFHRISRQGGALKITLHWSQHPDKCKGLYSVTIDAKGIPTVAIHDQKWHKENPGYEFVQKPGGYKGLRSPWYDKECIRRGSKMRIAQELDVDYNASAGQFADPAVIERLKQDTCLPALSIGELAFDMERFEPDKWINNAHGRLRLWTHLEEGRPPEGNYVIGGDVAIGTGASNSVWTVICADSNCVVAEFTSPTTKPAKFGEYGVALAKWFHGALLGWEANGPGRITGDRIIELGYSNIYYRRREESIEKQESSVAGFWTTPETKMALVAEYLRAIEAGELQERGEEVLDETLDYIIEDGRIEHSATKNVTDKSGARKNHGDRVISRGVAWLMRSVFGETEEEEAAEEINHNSYEGRRYQYEAALAAAGDDWGTEGW